ncbi:MAG: FAD-dependent thymidylate synthase [Candidatus Woesearchaeota archaeon]
MEIKKINVLDKGFVELLDTMPQDKMDMAVVSAARVSYLTDSKGEEKDKALIDFLMKHGHTSPFEMAEFKFRVKAPVVVWWQWVRHRMAEYNAQSGRYVKYDETEYYLPDKLRQPAKHNRQASDEDKFIEGQEHLIKEMEEHYKKGISLYNKLLEKGVAREEARLVLPGFAMYHTFIVKMNCHSLMNFINKRNHRDAQWEIRQYAKVIEDFFKEKMPWSYEAYKKWYPGVDRNLE